MGSDFSRAAGGLHEDFLSMLEAPATWSALTGKDVFGNNTYSSPKSIFVFVESINVSYGDVDNQGKKDNRQVYEAEMISDYHGIGLGDIIQFQGRSMNVSRVVTGNNELGEPLYQTVTATTAKRG